MKDVRECFVVGLVVVLLQDSVLLHELLLDRHLQWLRLEAQKEGYHSINQHHNILPALFSKEVLFLFLSLVSLVALLNKVHRLLLSHLVF